MKIISKYKEYYDYLQGIYGIDDYLILDRRNHTPILPERYIKGINTQTDIGIEYTFAICDELIVVYSYKNKFYHTVDEMIKLDAIMKNDKLSGLFPIHRWGTNKSIEERANDTYKTDNIHCTYNTKFREPVLVSKESEINGRRWSSKNLNDRSNWDVPYLGKFKFARWYKADAMFRDISAFIAWTKDNPEIPNKQTNEEKLLAHGFDKKISFRHRK